MLAKRFLAVRGLIALSKTRKQIQRVAERPHDPQCHAGLADLYAAQRRWVEAIAGYRSAIALGGSDVSMYLSLAKAYLAFGQADLARNFLEQRKAHISDSMASEVKQIITKSDALRPIPLSIFNHNRYFRLKSLADHITGLYNRQDISVLDIGGGDGALSLFLPDSRYVLAEPTVNGLSIDAFSKKSFDVVTACHVLEHIPLDERAQFLGKIATRAKKHVILLNPFYHPDGHVEERLKLVIELTGSLWAKEHLNCILPTIEEVKEFASRRDYMVRVSPNGSLATTLAFVFLDHYADRACRGKELRKINNFYNTLFFNKITDSRFPTAHLVEICVCNALKEKPL